MGIDTVQAIKTLSPKYGLIDEKSEFSAYRNMIKQEERKIGKDFSTWPREQQIKFMTDHMLDAMTQIYFREIEISDPAVIDPKSQEKAKDPHWFKDFYDGFDTSINSYYKHKIKTASSPEESRLAQDDLDHFMREIESHKRKNRSLMHSMGQLISGNKGYMPDVKIKGMPVQLRDRESVMSEELDLKQSRIDLNKEARRRAATFEQRVQTEKEK